MQPYEFINNLLDVNYKLTVRWLLLLALNPFTAWFWCTTDISLVVVDVEADYI